MRKQLLVFSGFAIAFTFLGFFPIGTDNIQYHSTSEMLSFQHYFLNNPPVDSNLHFPTSSHCEGCHSYDQLVFALVDDDGNDVNMFDDWSSSMMANSAKDPFWRAKVSHESLVIPDYVDEIQNKCTSCHAPMGHYQAFFDDELPYTMASLAADTLGQDGVSCGSCHTISANNLAQTFSGEITFDTSRLLYGPYSEDIYSAPMEIYVGFEPAYSEHILDAGVCAPCHTLITETFDLDGNPVGQTFVEQATYHEWLNSTYNTDDVNCQGCHMPYIEDSVVISANYNFLEKRFPYALHELVGANTFMLQLMKDNKAELGIDATNAAFNQTINQTFDILQQRSLVTDLTMLANQADTAYFELYLENQAGHKFPSGYPSRRAFVEFVVETEFGDTLFHSGAYDSDYELTGTDDNFEPHHLTINDPDQVQVYELVPGDVNGDFTTVLEFGAYALKDNRLPPIGFRKDHFTYDTVQIVGAADSDPDFNFETAEGSGTDRVVYAVGLNGYTGDINVTSRVYYQSLPLRWLEPMFEESTPEIDAFRPMFQEADHSPVLVKENNLEMLYVEGEFLNVQDIPVLPMEVYPNPSWEGRFYLEFEDGALIDRIEIWDVQGRRVPFEQIGNSEIWLGSSGIYILRVFTNDGLAVKQLIVQ